MVIDGDVATQRQVCPICKYLSKGKSFHMQRNTQIEKYILLQFMLQTSQYQRETNLGNHYYMQSSVCQSQVHREILHM